MRKFCYLYLTLFLLVGSLHADELNSRVISSITIVQKEPVRTDESALRRFLTFEEGQEFHNEWTLQQAIDENLKELKNTRYYTEVSIDVSERMQDEQGRIPVDLVVTTKDGWSLLIVPYPMPSSQIGKFGWQFGLDVTYENFFGTMTDFYLDSYANLAFGEAEMLRAWMINPQLINVDTGDLIFSFGLKQNYSVEQKKNDSAVLIQEFSRHNSAFEFGADVKLSRLWRYGFSPSIGFNYLYDWRIFQDGNNLAQDSQGRYLNREDFFYFQYNHYFSFGQVNWENSFRKGFLVELSNFSTINLSRAATTIANQIHMTTDVNLSASWYLPFWKILNYYTRGQALFVYNDLYLGLGERVRGIEDKTMNGNTAFSWQNTLAIRTTRSSSRISVQVHPFVDFGLAYDYRDHGSFEDMIRIGFGAELVAIFGGLDLRGRYGYDYLTGFEDLNFGMSLSY